jgi:signal transduction histidine kinase
LGIPVIVVSGTISEQLAIDCIKAGASDYLVKDRLARLPVAIASALESRRLRAQQVAAAAELARTAAELAAANKALRAADEVKDHLLAVTAHELRTPLTAIRGFAGLLREQWHGRARESGVEWVALIEEQAERTLAYVEDLLTLAAVHAGAAVLHPETVSLAPVLARASVLAVPAGVAITCPADAVVQADPVRLEQIVTNLLTNAVKHGGPLIGIEVDRDPTGASVEVRVRDDGPGVPDDFVPYLFDRFAQADATTKASGGCGLGLAIVAGLVAAHQGEIWYEPNTPSGACFAVRLPSPRRSQAADVAVSTMTRPATSPITISSGASRQ